MMIRWIQKTLQLQYNVKHKVLIDGEEEIEIGNEDENTDVDDLAAVIQKSVLQKLGGFLGLTENNF